MDTRLRSFSRRALLLALAATVTACAETTPRWDSSFGNTVRSTFAAQIINPAAARNANPVNGMDGRAAQAAQQKYESASADPAAGAAPPSLMNGGGGK